MTIVENQSQDVWSEDDLIDYAGTVRFDNDDGSPAYFDPKAGDWHYDSAFPLSAFLYITSEEKWKEWLKSEIEVFTYDLGHDRGYTAMMSEEIEEPIVVSIYQGKAYVWDGFHRIGISIAKGQSTIKAVVGYRS